MKIPLGLLFDNPISLSASGDEHRRAVPSSPTNHYPRPLQSQASGWILRGSSRMTSIVQWLFSLSLLNNLFGCTTENISVNVNVENISTQSILQRLKALLYKDFVPKLYRRHLKVPSRIHPTAKSTLAFSCPSFL